MCLTVCIHEHTTQLLYFLVKWRLDVEKIVSFIIFIRDKRREEWRVVGKEF